MWATGVKRLGVFVLFLSLVSSPAAEVSAPLRRRLSVRLALADVPGRPYGPLSASIRAGPLGRWEFSCQIIS
jgi:hypothetical protein